MRRTAIRVLAVVAVLLVIAGGAAAFTWPEIRFLLVSKQDQPFVDLTYRRAGSLGGVPFGTPSSGKPDPRFEARWRESHYPVVRRELAQVCVTLHARQSLGALYESCFDARTRAPLRETIIAF